MTKTVDSLETQLAEKEQLVAALTERLEQAAEQLDRVHRTGADRGVRTGGGFPAELIEEHKVLVEDLGRAVHQWEDMQAATTLGGLEIQLSELRDIVAGNIAQGHAIATASPSLPQTSSRHVDGDSPPNVNAASNPPASGMDAYEALKTSLLEADAGPVSEKQEQQPTANEESPTETIFQSEEISIDDVEPPPPIDVTVASSEDLQHAVEVRDSYIAYLIGRLRNGGMPSRLPDNWQELDNIPDELRNRLEELESKLNESLRIAEVELSLERARLGREEARLKIMEQQIEKELKRMGLDSNDDEENEFEDDSAEETQPAPSRWMRLLGRGSNDEDE